MSIDSTLNRYIPKDIYENGQFVGTVVKSDILGGFKKRTKDDVPFRTVAELEQLKREKEKPDES